MLDQTYDQAALCRDPARLMARDFLEEHREALGNTARLLGGSAAALGVERLVCEIQGETGRLSLGTRRRMIRLHGLLSLCQTDGSDPEFLDLSCAVDPFDPRVHELCLLSEDLARLLDDIDAASNARPTHAVNIRQRR